MVMGWFVGLGVGSVLSYVLHVQIEQYKQEHPLPLMPSEEQRHKEIQDESGTRMAS